MHGKRNGDHSVAMASNSLKSPPVSFTATS